MNQERIGNLISELRKKKNLTQTELGNLVGVTGQAVSRWEKGLSIPDVSIINSLSDVLGVTSTELLNGEQIIEEDFDEAEVKIKSAKEKLKKKIKLIIVIILGIVVIGLFSVFTLFFFGNYDKYKIYTISSNSSEFNVNGVLTISGDKGVLMISKFYYLGSNVSEVYDLDYELRINEQKIYTSVDANGGVSITNGKVDTFNNLVKKVTIYISNYDDKKELSVRNFIGKEMVIIFKYVGDNKRSYEYRLPLLISEKSSSTKLTR